MGYLREWGDWELNVECLSGALLAIFRIGWEIAKEIYLITKLQIQRYQKFNGDLDDWVRSQKDGLDGTLTGDDWTLIDKVVQRLKIQRNGNASLDYKTETERLLKKVFENPEVIQIARSMAK